MCTKLIKVGSAVTINHILSGPAILPIFNLGITGRALGDKVVNGMQCDKTSLPSYSRRLTTGMYLPRGKSDISSKHVARLLLCSGFMAVNSWSA